MTAKSSNKSARDTVYHFLHKKIIEMQIMPGAVINPKELAEYLQVSRTPIRDALMQLEKESLVETAPQKGTYVSKIDIQRVRDERFMRACLEEKIAALFLKSYTDSDYKQMEMILLRQKEAYEHLDTRTFLQLDNDFHAVMYHVTSHTYCLEMIQNLSGHYHRIRLLSLSDPDICASTIQQHKELLMMIKDKHLEELQKQIIAHITEKGMEVIKLQKRYPSLFSTILVEEPSDRNIWEGDFLAEV